jgi:hypothetical protein
MYLPYVIKRHGNRAWITNYNYMLKNLSDKKLELLLVKKNSETIAGALILFENHQPRLWNLGIKKGNFHHVKNGAIAALYYFTALYMEKLGYESFSVGHSRAFLTDGVLQYKRKWGLRPIEPQGLRKIQNIIFKSGIIVKLPLLSESTKGFFLTNPFIFERKGIMNVAVFVQKALSPSAEAQKELFKRNYIHGICKIYIYDFEEFRLQKKYLLKAAK